MKIFQWRGEVSDDSERMRGSLHYGGKSAAFGRDDASLRLAGCREVNS
jgi:hypothetical protein